MIFPDECRTVLTNSVNYCSNTVYGLFGSVLSGSSNTIDSDTVENDASDCFGPSHSESLNCTSHLVDCQHDVNHLYPNSDWLIPITTCDDLVTL